jgi:hypothetical protein
MQPRDADADARPGEIRLSTYARRVARRWYVVVVCVAIAVLLVVLRGLGAGTTSRAEATVYLGQPLGTASAPIANAPSSNVAAATEFVTADLTLRRAARDADMSVDDLRGGVTARAVVPTGTNARTTPAGPYVYIVVDGSFSRGRATAAVRSLGDQLMGRSSNLYNAKTQILRGRISSGKAQLSRLQRSVRDAQAAIDRIAGSADLSPVDKATVSSPYVALLQSAVTQISEVTAAVSEDQLQLATARDVEAPAFLSGPSSQRRSPTTERTSLLVAAFVGLLIGTALALAWDAARTRPPARDGTA